MKKHLVFAYGSNMNPRQMQRRCPGAKPVGVATLDGYRLTFVGKSSTWGGGVATIEPDRRTVVIGFVWLLSAADLQSLDGFEGYPFVYDREFVQVALDDGEIVWCQTHRHQADRVRRSEPSALYLRTILDGYKWAGARPSATLRRLFAAVSAAEHA